MSNFETNLNQKNLSKLQVEIIKLRSIIRYHRDQRGDNRCWLDDELLYEALPETANITPTLPSKEFFMDRCTRFHSKRQDPVQTKQIKNSLEGRVGVIFAVSGNASYNNSSSSQQ